MCACPQRRCFFGDNLFPVCVGAWQKHFIQLRLMILVKNNYNTTDIPFNQLLPGHFPDFIRTNGTIAILFVSDCAAYYHMEMLFKIQLHCCLFIFAKSNSASTIKVISAHCAWRLLVLNSRWLFMPMFSIFEDSEAPDLSRHLPCLAAKRVLYPALAGAEQKRDGCYPPLVKVKQFKAIVAAP